MTEFWWALTGLAAVVGLAWVMNWSRWDPKDKDDAGKDLRARHHVV